MSYLKKIIQADLRELHRLILEASDEVHPQDILYAKAIRGYLNGDLAELKKCYNVFPEFEILNLIISIRIDVKSFSVDLKKLKDLEALTLQLNKYDTWRSEAFFILGLAWCEINEFEKSKDFYIKAYNSFWTQGLKRKAVKSLLNYVVSESRLNEDKKLIFDYEQVYEKAIEIDDKIIAGICQLNIAREYRKIGGIDIALKLVNQCLENLLQDKGTNHYYYAHLERCLIYLDMNNLLAAYSDYQIVKAARQLDVEESLKVVRDRLGQKESVKATYLDPAWVDCLSINKHTEIKLTKNEIQLLKLLQNGPTDKNDIMLSLYGDKISYESSDNRFKVLVSRLRKKIPGAVRFVNGLYELTEKSCLEEVNAINL